MWHALENLFSAFNLQMALLVGTGLLAICLLVLALTRWGQSSPVWKCVILSFAAHILLFVYAYGTDLIFEPPAVGVPGTDQLRVNLIASHDEGGERTEILNAIPDWSSDATQIQLPPIVDSLERAAIDSELVIERVIPSIDVRPEIDFHSQLPTPTDSSEPLDILPQVPLEIVDLSRDNPKLDSPEIQVERRREDPSLTEPPQFFSSQEWSRLDSNPDFEPTPLSQDDLNPHLNGLDLNLIDREAEIAQSDSPPTLPPPALTSPESFSPLPRSSPPDPRFKQVSGAWRAADGKPMPEVYSLRNAADREQIVQQRGGTPDTEAAVQQALRWLVQSQERDGRWDAQKWGAGVEKQVLGHDRKGAGAQADTGITGLAILALLAGGNSHLEGPYQDSIHRALDFLILKQRPDGDLSGNARLFAKTYCHSMALLALSEALAMTGDPRLMSAVQKGVDYSVQGQNRVDGGWRYQPGDSGDMSQHGWKVLALHSARTGGARVPEEAFERMRRFVDTCASGSFGGLSSYRPRQGVSTTMTAEALVCRYILSEQLSSHTISEAARRIAAERPTALHINLYYWYYGTLAMYQVGGSDWELWNTEMKKALLSTQVTTGPDAGSWPPDCMWGGYGGRVYSTALATLNLQVYYRYMPNSRTAAVVDELPDAIKRR